jgi:Zn-dependent M16 (insulinase) family peptidase
VSDSFDFNPGYYKDYFALPSQTNYVTETFFTPAYHEAGSEKLELLTELMSRGQLHRLIREQGGAYGAGAKYSPFSGAFTFYSYRDPFTLETLDNFAKSIDWVASGDFT